jgi:hypothetical protein
MSGYGTLPTEARTREQRRASILPAAVVFTTVMASMALLLVATQPVSSLPLPSPVLGNHAEAVFVSCLEPPGVA